MHCHWGLCVWPCVCSVSISKGYVVRMSGYLRKRALLHIRWWQIWRYWRWVLGDVIEWLHEWGATFFAFAAVLIGIAQLLSTCG